MIMFLGLPPHDATGRARRSGCRWGAGGDRQGLVGLYEVPRSKLQKSYFAARGADGAAELGSLEVDLGDLDGAAIEVDAGP